MEEAFIIEKLKAEETRRYGFNLLVKAYQQRVYWHIRKMVVDHEDSDDIMQEVFIKVWKNLDKFREDSSLFTWIYRIATNECLGFLKKKKRRFFLPINDVTAELTGKLSDSSNVLLDGEAIEIKLQKALLTLPDKQRVVFNMRYYDNLSFADISEVTETSVGALKASYHHAAKKVEKLVQVDL
ncbi:MAG: RNA polymerase sigma factor [Cyclobacteriaceae bacterium]